MPHIRRIRDHPRETLVQNPGKIAAVIVAVGSGVGGEEAVQQDGGPVFLVGEDGVIETLVGGEGVVCCVEAVLGGCD